MAMFQGKAHWAKIVGQPSWGYKKQHKEWAIDVEVDDTTREKLIAEGAPADKFKESADGTYTFIKFKRREFKRDGTPGQPFRIVDATAKPWDNRLIGNGSTINVKYIINTNNDGDKKLDALAFQVVELVPYEGKPDFEPVEGAAQEEEKWD